MTVTASIARNNPDNDPIPQYLNDTLPTPAFEVVTGKNGGSDVNVIESALPSGASTANNQTTIIGHIDGLETALTTLIAKDYATQTTLAALLAKVIASPATEATLTSIKDTSGIKKITDALPSGTNLLGKTSIDQTTDGTTNRVVSKISQTAGENIVICGASTNNIGDVDVLTLPAYNVDGTAFASAARTATVSSTDLANSSCTGIKIILDVTAVATSDIKVSVEGKDPASGKYYTILQSASVTTISTNVYKVCPGLTAVANVTASDFVPKTFRITMTHANANSTTYSVGYSLI